MLSAAKREHGFSLAALPCASENSRLGFATSTNELHRAFGFANSNTATGLRVCLYDEGRGSRSTGKERGADSEGGLDYFGARYYGSALGRFTSPDPANILNQKLTDPQQWGMYAYVRNSPFRFVDPTGKFVELTGDDEARKQQLDALKTAVGRKAGAYLYDNVNKSTGKHYVGILSGGADGKGQSFNSINANANKLGGIVQDSSHGLSLQLVSPGTEVHPNIEGTTAPNQEVTQTIGSGRGGTTPGFTAPDGSTIYLTSGSIANLSGSLSSSGNPAITTLGDVLAHELGNVDSYWYHGGQDTKGDAVRTENGARGLAGEPLRSGHDRRGDVALSGTPF